MGQTNFYLVFSNCVGVSVSLSLCIYMYMYVLLHVIIRSKMRKSNRIHVHVYFVCFVVNVSVNNNQFFSHFETSNHHSLDFNQHYRALLNGSSSSKQPSTSEVRNPGPLLSKSEALPLGHQLTLHCFEDDYSTDMSEETRFLPMRTQKAHRISSF